MTRLEKCELLKCKGYTYNPETGKIFGVRGKEIISKNSDGYIRISFRNGKDRFDLRGHHFAWYMSYGNVDFIELDHKDTNPLNNCIDNLRILTHQQNQFNKKPKGYTWNEKSKKWQSQIMLNGKNIFLGLFDTEKKAKEKYLEAKEKYHLF